MDELKRLREKRNTIVSAMQALVTKAESENRGFTSADDAEWSKFENQLVELDTRLRRAEQFQSLNRAAPSQRTIYAGGYVSTDDAQWRNISTGATVRVLNADQPMATVDMGEATARFGDYARALVIGPRNEAERRALNEGTTTAGGHLVPTPLASSIIDRMRAATVVFRAGARTVEMDSQTLKIAKVTGDPTASWLAEAASMSSSDPTFGAVTLTAKTLRCLIVASREVIEDAPNFGEVLGTILSNAFAVELDRAALMGSGTGAEPQGLVNQAGLGAVTNGANGATLANYDKYVDAVQALLDANAPPATAWIIAPRTQAQFGKLKDTTNQPLVPPAMVATIPQLVTTSIPVTQTVGTSTDCTTAFVGDFRQMLIGVRNEFTIRVLNERYADTHQVGFVAALRADVQLAQPAAFAKITGIRA